LPLFLVFQQADISVYRFVYDIFYLQIDGYAINVRISFCQALAGLDNLSCFDPDFVLPEGRMLRYGPGRKLSFLSILLNLVRVIKAAVNFVVKVATIVDNALAVVTTTVRATATASK
jgi:hypothetical protein